MKIAISTDNGRVSEHFGRCPDFTIIELEGGQITDRYSIPNPGHHPGFLPEFFSRKGVNAVVAGGMGQRALKLFDQYRIKPFPGITGEIDKVVEELASGELQAGESICSPGRGKGYGVEKTDKEEEGS